MSFSAKPAKTVLYSVIIKKPPVPPSKPTDIPPAWISFDLMYKEIKKRLPRVAKYKYADQSGADRLINTITEMSKLFSNYRTFKYVNLLEVVEYSH